MPVALRASPRVSLSLQVARPRRRLSAMPSAPRAHAAAATGAAVGVAAWAAYYVLRCRLPPSVRAGPTALNAALLARLPALRAPYAPPIWAFNAWVQLIVYVYRQSKLPRNPPFRRETLTTADGGTVALDWWHDEPAAPDAPVLLVLHTITGTSRDFIDLARLAAARGWRVAVCLRRGHLDVPLTSPRCNLLGSTADLRLQVAAVRARHPGAPLLMVGASAGTGLLVRYLGEEGSASTVAAAVAVCPGYDTSEGGAFSRFSPVLDRHILAACKAFFLRRQNHDMLSAVPGYDRLRSARSIADYQRQSFALEGYADVDALHAGTNPMGVARAIRTPLLVINAADDPVCDVSNVHDNAALYDEPHDRMLLLTSRGGHCTFYEGKLWPGGSWADRVALDYLQEVLQLRAEAAGATNKGSTQAPAEAVASA
jgi:predicted alpha/beta-fold hydrolase